MDTVITDTVINDTIQIEDTIIIIPDSLNLDSDSNDQIKKPDTTTTDSVTPDIFIDTIFDPELPDLILSDFSVNQNAVQHGTQYYEYPFSITMSNIGTAASIKGFDLSFLTYAPPTQWTNENQPKFNCIRFSQELVPGTSTVYSGTLKILKNQLYNHDVRIKASVDSECSQESPDFCGSIDEKNEYNNYSNEITLSKIYNPSIENLTPDSTVAGSNEILMISGNELGISQGSHTVLLQKGATKVAAQITNWVNGAIYFQLPSNIKPGVYTVTIADAATLEKCPESNEVTIHVYGKKVLLWTDLIKTWNLFSNVFSLKLNTYGGGSSYNNTSQLIVLQPKPIHVDNMEFEYKIFKYRFLINDFNSLPDSIMLTRQDCLANQLKIEIFFESDGVELKGFNRAKLGGPWCDWCVPDIHVNDAKLTVTFNFSANRDTIDFTIDSDFTSNVSVSNELIDGLMDIILGDWNQDIKDQINNGVRDGLQDPDNKTYIISELTKMIRLVLGLSDKPITAIDFTDSGIIVLY